MPVQRLLFLLPLLSMLTTCGKTDCLCPSGGSPAGARDPHCALSFIDNSVRAAVERQRGSVYDFTLVTIFGDSVVRRGPGVIAVHERDTAPAAVALGIGPYVYRHFYSGDTTVVHDSTRVASRRFGRQASGADTLPHWFGAQQRIAFYRAGTLLFDTMTQIVQPLTVQPRGAATRQRHCPPITTTTTLHWNPDPQNTVVHLAIKARRNPEARQERLYTYYLETPDDGELTLRSEYFEGLPDGTLVEISLARGGGVVLTENNATNRQHLAAFTAKATGWFRLGYAGVHSVQ